MGGDLTNCPRCGKLYIKYSKSVCPSCVQEVEQQYITCAEYLREHKLVSTYELSEATGVSVSQINQFIREGRISVADLPNLGYPCEICGTQIREGRFCKACADRLNKDIQKVLGDKQAQESEADKQEIYYQFKNRFNK